MRSLTPSEEAWCDFVNSLPADMLKRHDKDQALSIQAFEGGVASERRRVRQEMRKMWARLSEIDPGDRGDFVRSEIDRHLPEPRK